MVQQSSTPHLRGVGGDEDEREEAEDQVKDVAADRLGLDDDGVLDHLQSGSRAVGRSGNRAGQSAGGLGLDDARRGPGSPAGTST